MSSKTGGFAFTESLILTVIVVSAVLLPVPGLGESVFGMLASALRNFQAHSTLLLSMP